MIELTKKLILPNFANCQGTIHLRRRQIFTIFDPYPPLASVGSFFTTIRRQIWPIFDPSPPTNCRCLKWMVLNQNTFQWMFNNIVLRWNGPYTKQTKLGYFILQRRRSVQKSRELLVIWWALDYIVQPLRTQFTLLFRKIIFWCPIFVGRTSRQLFPLDGLFTCNTVKELRAPMYCNHSGM